MSLAHPVGLVALVAPALALAVWLRWPPRLGRAASRAALGVRVCLLGSLALALAGPAIDARPAGQTLAAAVDRSTSLLGALGGEPATVAALAKGMGSHDRFGVVTFGRTALVEDAPSSQPAAGGIGTRPDPGFTDMEDGLRLSAALMPATTRSHVVLVGDGRQNVGDAIAQARLLRSQGVRVDVLPVAVRSGPEVRIDGVLVPATVAKGSRAQVRVLVHSDVATTARLSLEVDGAVVADLAEPVRVGASQVDAALPPAAPGFHTVRALISPARDTLPGNNAGEGLFQVLGTPRILVVEGQPGAGTNLVRALGAASMAATIVAPDLVPSSAAAVAAYQSVALVDVAADQLGPARMTALATATRDLGVGLAAFGGPHTFGPGGLAGTPLEAALPIDMRVHDTKVKAPVAVVVVLETVENPAGDAVVRGAVRSLVAKLSPQDYVGVTDADGGSGMAVPLQKVANGRRVQAAIAAIPSFGDPPSYDPYLAEAEGALTGLPGVTKHVIVLGDGDAQPPSPALVAGLVGNGITVSAVGVDVHGSPQFMAVMQTLAQEGNGRFYQSESASQVPDIFLQEQHTQLQPWIVQRRFVPSVGAPSPALAGLDLSSLPPLAGYVSATTKGAAEVVLGGPGGDPVLAQWRYGLGRSAAWTSDTQGRWSADLLSWPGSARLLAGIVASTLPLAPDPGLQVSTTLDGDRAHVIAQLASVPGGAGAGARVVAPDGTSSQVALVATAPGRYEGDFPATQVGSYLARISVTSGGRVVRAATAGLAVAYSPELRYVGTDRAFLAQVARAGGGVVLSSPSQAWAVPVPPVVLTRSLVWWLLGLAALLVPVDVAVRRLVLRPGDVQLWRSRRAPAGPEPATRQRSPAPGDQGDALGGIGGDPGGGDLESADLAARLVARRRRREPLERRGAGPGGMGPPT